MGWQAEVNDDFDLIGGWAFVPGGNGVNDEVMSAPDGAVAALRAVEHAPAGLDGARARDDPIGPDPLATARCRGGSPIRQRGDRGSGDRRRGISSHVVGRRLDMETKSFEPTWSKYAS